MITHLCPDGSSHVMAGQPCLKGGHDVGVREIIGGKTEPETRFHTSSLAADAERQGEAIRSHWGIENSHHWVMDVVFRDDEYRIRKANAPANFATIKHMASILMRAKAGKHSMRVKRRLAAWDDASLASLIAAG